MVRGSSTARSLRVSERSVVSVRELQIPAKAHALRRRARQALENGDAERAIARLQRAVETAPEFVEAWNDLGTLANGTRDFALAETYFRTALDHDPDAFAPLVNLGGVVLAQGRYAEAAESQRAGRRGQPGRRAGQRAAWHRQLLSARRRGGFASPASGAATRPGPLHPSAAVFGGDPRPRWSPRSSGLGAGAAPSAPPRLERSRPRGIGPRKPRRTADPCWAVNDGRSGSSRARSRPVCPIG